MKKITSTTFKKFQRKTPHFPNHANQSSFLTPPNQTNPISFSHKFSSPTTNSNTTPNRLYGISCLQMNFRLAKHSPNWLCNFERSLSNFTVHLFAFPTNLTAIFGPKLASIRANFLLFFCAFQTNFLRVLRALFCHIKWVFFVEFFRVRVAFGRKGFSPSILGRNSLEVCVVILRLPVFDEVLWIGLCVRIFGTGVFRGWKGLNKELWIGIGKVSICDCWIWNFVAGSCWF
jgi:hypothetical protein